MISELASASGKERVLFICFHNSARSQMAEGLLRDSYGDRYEAYSAGVETTRVDPRAVRVMGEIGIDISGQHSKRMNEYQGVLFDIAVTVCDKAKEMCPICGVGLEAPPPLRQQKIPFTRLLKIRLLPKDLKKISSPSFGR
jgi:arsenate reductase